MPRLWPTVAAAALLLAVAAVWASEGDRDKNFRTCVHMVRSAISRAPCPDLRVIDVVGCD